MSLLSRLKAPAANGFGYGSSADDVTRDLDLSSRTILLTGCAAGLGRETLRALCARGARVIATARSEAQAREACVGVAAQALPLACDLASPGSVRACSEAIRQRAPRLDAIICNAGIMALPKLTRAYGYELQFFTNHVGHFLLVTGLLDRLAEHGRVVMVSSNAHRRAPREGIQFDNLSGDAGYDPFEMYGQSKLANLLFSSELARRLAQGQSSNALHPGVIATTLSRSSPVWARVALQVLAPVALKSPAQGAATQCYVAVHPGMQSTGRYFVDCNPKAPSALGSDAALAERLWSVTERIVSAL
jgi:NAD(P)-dependent dehydrogenase (short-subunit alcohol dehydrogenase family)